jgi:hypothetical protein
MGKEEAIHKFMRQEKNYGARLKIKKLVIHIT